MTDAVAAGLAALRECGCGPEGDAAKELLVREIQAAGRNDGERFNYLTLPQTAALRMAVEPFDKAFPDAIGVYHVGSSLTTRDYRDVDVRLILRDEQFEHLFGKDDKTTGHVDFWCLTCLAYSEWLRHRTGLPVDFQITSMTEAKKHKGKPRNALMLSYEADKSRHAGEE